MTQPYKRLVSDGVYAMPAGQLKVTAAGGMKIQVSAGAAKVGSRWLESDAIETFTLDPSDVALNQIYAVVIRDDNSENVRKISIALKKGSPLKNSGEERFSCPSPLSRDRKIGKYHRIKNRRSTSK